MRTYHEHRRLVAMVRELADLLDRRSLLLLKLARRKAIPATMADDSPLNATWPHLSSAFHLLVYHAASLDAELKRLHVSAGDQTDCPPSAGPERKDQRAEEDTGGASSGCQGDDV